MKQRNTRGRRNPDPHIRESTLVSMKVVAYARVSTDEQARSGYSVADQEEALRA